MQCPACQKEMVEHDFGGAHVDVCDHGCHGLWFDWGELRRLDEKHEGLGQALERALAQQPHEAAARDQLSCPRCNTPMHEHRHRHSKRVDVDECYQCGGFFLDAGELGLVRDTDLANAERQRFTRQMSMTTATTSAPLGRGPATTQRIHAFTDLSSVFDSLLS